MPRTPVKGASHSSWETFATGINDIRGLVQCKICTNLMYEPYTVKCGHTFCYACLSQWIDSASRRSKCPDCRTKITEEPIPNYTIRNIVHVFLGNTAFLEDGETAEELRAQQQSQAKDLEHERRLATGLFKGRFVNTIQDVIRDTSDNVDRCPNCNWEIEGNTCEHCGITFDSDSTAQFSDGGDMDSLLDDLDENDLPGPYLSSQDHEEESDYANTDDQDFIDDEDDGDTTDQELRAIRDAVIGGDTIDRYDGTGTVRSPYELSSNDDSNPRVTGPDGTLLHLYDIEDGTSNDELFLRRERDESAEEDSESESYDDADESAMLANRPSAGSSRSAHSSWPARQDHRHRFRSGLSQSGTTNDGSRGISSRSRAARDLSSDLEASTSRRARHGVIDLTTPHRQPRSTNRSRRALPDDVDDEDAEPIVRRARRSRSFSSQEDDQSSSINTSTMRGDHDAGNGNDEDETSTEGTSEDDGEDTSEEDSTGESESERVIEIPQPQRPRKRTRMVLDSDDEEIAAAGNQNRTEHGRLVRGRVRR